MRIRELLLAVAAFAAGILLGLAWRDGDPARAPPTARGQIEGEGTRLGPERPAVGDDRAAPIPDPAAAEAGRVRHDAPWGPDPEGGRARIEVDFRSVPQDAWFGCAATVEGVGTDGNSVVLTDKPYRGGRVVFDIPAGRWRVTWRTSLRAAETCGRVVVLRRDEHMVVASSDPGDERGTWIRPGLGLLDLTVLAPSGRPCAAPVVVGRVGHDGFRVRAETDHHGRCRIEIVPGRLEVYVGDAWM